MDIFAHMLWTNVVYRKKYLSDIRSRLWAVFFGVACDFVSFVPATIYGFLNYGKGHLMALANSDIWVFWWARNSYNYSHSLVTFVVAVIIVAAFRKGKIWWPMFGWLLHIIIDAFTHPDFYQTPLLYPISGFKNTHAISWADPHFMLVNYSSLALAYIVIFVLWRKRKSDAKKVQS